MKFTKVKSRQGLPAPPFAVIPAEQQGPPNERPGAMFPLMNSAVLLLDLQDSLEILSQRSVWKSKLMSMNTVILADDSLQGKQSNFFVFWIMVNFSKNVKKNCWNMRKSEYFLSGLFKTMSHAKVIETVCLHHGYSEC